jgi:hypothetical protein
MTKNSIRKNAKSFAMVSAITATRMSAIKNAQAPASA